MKIYYLLLCSLMVCGWQNQTTAQSQFQRGLSFAEEFKNLPYFKTGTQTYQNSSTDPAEDQFNDHSNWLYTDNDSSAVLVDIDGPGCIYRIWSTGNSGDTNRVKVYIDGHKTPDIDETFNSFHSHPPLRNNPQVGAGGDTYLAWWSYMPIPFDKSCKIVRKGNLRPFYNISYHTYTDNTGVKSWNGKENYQKLEQMWEKPETDPKPVAGNITQQIKANIAPGQTLNVFNYRGKGYIASIKISKYLQSKDFRIKIYWDNETVASVDAPVKWFFGSVDKGGDLRALGIGTVNNNGYCYFPMPYWKNARIELVNNTDDATGDMNIELQYNKTPYAKGECGYFHAKANEIDKPGEKYTCLKTQGRGHVIGMAKRMPAGGHACEADEVYYIDNRKFPDIYGTGEEDHANCAWWGNSYNSYPTHGCVGNDCYYRLYYPDVIVYEQALDMQFESWANFYIASLVWYYEDDKSILELTDSLDIGKRESEKLHNYKVSGETWLGEKKGQYPGKRIYNYSVDDDGRSFNGYNEFKVRIDKKNKGVRLRLRTENGFQAVKVVVDGVPVEERMWSIAKNRFDAFWVDADFEIPAKYTKNKVNITIRLECLPSNKGWTEYGYQVFSYRN